MEKKWHSFSNFFTILNSVFSIGISPLAETIIAVIASVDSFYRSKAKAWRLVITFGPPLVCTFINALFLEQTAPLILSETQVMYSFSAMAQVIAGIFGLTLTATVFFNQRLEKICQDNEDAVEAYDDIKNINHFFLICISIISIISVVLCFTSIYFYGQKNISANTLKFFLNETSFFSIFSIILIVLYGIDLINENRINKMLDTSKRRLESKFNVFNNRDIQNHGDLAQFLGVYNKLEKLIRDKAIESINKNGKAEDKYQDFYTGLKILVSNGDISSQLASRILDIRRYRNSLVHGSDFIVALEIQEELNDIYNRLESAFLDRK